MLSSACRRLHRRILRYLLLLLWHQWKRTLAQMKRMTKRLTSGFGRAQLGATTATRRAAVISAEAVLNATIVLATASPGALCQHTSGTFCSDFAAPMRMPTTGVRNWSSPLNLLLDLVRSLCGSSAAFTAATMGRSERTWRAAQPLIPSLRCRLCRLHRHRHRVHHPRHSHCHLCPNHLRLLRRRLTWMPRCQIAHRFHPSAHHCRPILPYHHLTRRHPSIH